MYTVVELVEKTSYPKNAILNIAKRLGFGVIVKVDGVLKKMFNDDETRIIINAMSCGGDYKEQSLQELKKLHPLVTDERCFNENWFPEKIPCVLEEPEDIE